MNCAAAIILLSVTLALPTDLHPPLCLVSNETLSAIEAPHSIHAYGSSSLIHCPPDPTETAIPILRHIEAGKHVNYRSWHAPVSDQPQSVSSEPGIYVVAFVGPIDQRWREQCVNRGATILDTAHPNALVLKANGAQLRSITRIVTSEGVPAIRGAVELAPVSRLSRYLLDHAPDEPVTVRISGFLDDSLLAVAKRAGLPLDDHRRLELELTPTALLDLAAEFPEIAFIEPVFGIGVHNNLTVQAGLTGASELWQDPGVTGRDIIIASNDTGLDLEHPDFPPESIVATTGVMAYTDTGHGTHTAGTLAGRGSSSSPINTSACGDVIAPLQSVRGVAWQADLAVNNIMNGGLAEVPEMMTWGSRHGASVSANSWAIDGLTTFVTGYTQASLQADRASRDADPGTAGNQELTIVFSGGNTGPEPSSLLAPGTAKNVLAVGATQNLRCGSYVPEFEDGPNPDSVLELSGRGPSQNRVKPDLVAPGADVLSTRSQDVEATAPWDQGWTGELYALGTGTSMACPFVAGAAALFHEAYYRDHGFLPSSALTRAALINGATDLGLPRADQGWGRIDAFQAIHGPTDGRVTLIEQDRQLATGDRQSFDCLVASDRSALRITLVWTDVPGEADADHPLVNDLDLELIAPDGTRYRGNRFGTTVDGRVSLPNPSSGDSDNTVETIIVAHPMSGPWRIDVTAVAVPENPPRLDGQDFALVFSGDASPCERPEAPAWVSAEASGDNQIEVRWAPVANASAYRVLRARNQGGRPYFPIATLDGDTTVFDDTDVSGTLEYFYVVQTMTDCWSTNSLEASARATGACREAPEFEGLSALEDAHRVSCSLSLAWEEATSPCPEDIRYSVYRSTDPAFVIEASTLLASGLTTTELVDEALTPTQSYTYVVRARGAESETEETNEVRRTARPSGPQHIFFESDAEVDNQGLATEFGPSDDQTSQPWQRSDFDAHASDHAWQVLSEDRVKDVTLRLARPLAVSHQIILEFFHRFDLEVKRDGGRLEYSTDNGVTWFDILAGDGFAIPSDPDRFVEGGYNDTVAGTNPLPNGPAWTGKSTGWERVRVDLTAMEGSSILLRWRFACNDANAFGGGWWLDDIRLYRAESCLSCTSPPPPENLVATALDDGIHLSWNAVGGAISYHLYRSGRDGGPYDVLGSGLADTTYHDVAVSGGSRYFYVVDANDGCRSEYSIETSATALGGCTLPPVFWGLAGATNSELNTCAIDLRWAPARPQCAGSRPGYRIYRSRDAAFEAGPATYLAETTDTSFRDFTIEDSTPYSYIVRSFDRRNGAEDLNSRAHRAAATAAVVRLFADDLEQGGDNFLTAPGSAADRGTQPWEISTTDAASPIHSFFVSNEPTVKDQVLQLVEAIEIPPLAKPTLEFEHFFDFETFWDGGRLEYSSDDGEHWHDILDGDGLMIPANDQRFLSGEYPVDLAFGSGANPLAGEPAWTGTMDSWYTVRVDLTDFIGHEILIRWRTASDDSRNRVGWWVDDIRIAFTATCTPKGVRQPAGRRP